MLCHKSENDRKWLFLANFCKKVAEFDISRMTCDVIMGSILSYADYMTFIMKF